MDVLCRWLNLYLEAFALFWLLEHNYQFRWDHLWLRGVKYLLALASIALFRLDPTTTYFSTPNFGLYLGVLAGIGFLFCFPARQHGLQKPNCHCLYQCLN